MNIKILLNKRIRPFDSDKFFGPFVDFQYMSYWMHQRQRLQFRSFNLTIPPPEYEAFILDRSALRNNYCWTVFSDRVYYGPFYNADAVFKFDRKYEGQILKLFFPSE